MKLAAGALVGIVSAVAAPAVLSMVGFTGAGVAAGSIAAGAQVDNNPFCIHCVSGGYIVSTVFQK